MLFLILFFMYEGAPPEFQRVVSVLSTLSSSSLPIDVYCERIAKCVHKGEKRKRIGGGDYFQEHSRVVGSFARGLVADSFWQTVALCSGYLHDVPEKKFGKYGISVENPHLTRYDTYWEADSKKINLSHLLFLHSGAQYQVPVSRILSKITNLCKENYAGYMEDLLSFHSKFFIEDGVTLLLKLEDLSLNNNPEEFFYDVSCTRRFLEKRQAKAKMLYECWLLPADESLKLLQREDDLFMMNEVENLFALVQERLREISLSPHDIFLVKKEEPIET